MSADYTYEDALHLVDNESPGSTPEQKRGMARHIIKVMNETGESPERIWLDPEYWKDGY